MAKTLILLICVIFLLAIAESQKVVSAGRRGSNGALKNSSWKERGYVISSAKYSAMRPARDGRLVKLREEDQKTFGKKMLRLINRRRTWHGSQPLVLNVKERNRAQLAAENMAYAQNQSQPFITYSTCNNINGCPGENMGYALSLYRNASQVLNLTVFLEKGNVILEKWYNEKEDYDYNDPTKSYNSGKDRDFTQMLWNGTTSVAFGAAVTKVNHSDILFLAAQFYPRGNIMGFYEINVFRKINESSTYSNNTK